MGCPSGRDSMVTGNLPRSGSTIACQSGLMSDFRELVDAIRAFNIERDWGQFHDPKSVALALVGEVGEVAELLQWIPAEMAAQEASAGSLHDRIAEELADVLTYLVVLADSCDVDLIEASLAKLARSRSRFPVDKISGTAVLKHEAPGDRSG